jgi:hypothetical protein
VQDGRTNPDDAEPIDILFDFADPRSFGDWYPADDVVMGGNSESEVRPTNDGTALFSGTVVLEGGGFASVRADFVPPRDLSGFDGIALLVKGDGKRYAVTLRSGDRPSGFPAYRAAFGTRAGAWETVMLPLPEFEPFFRGQALQEAPLLNTAAVSSINLLIAERQGGTFRLEMERVSAYRSSGAQETALEVRRR